QIHAPERVFEQPAYATPVDRTFAQEVRLLGYSLAPVTDLASLHTASVPSLTVTLVWQGLQEMQTSYRVFVHLIDGEGQILAQSDAEPAQWARPTTGWMPGEYVVDEHTLPLPARMPDADLALRVGLFDAESGERLQLPSGEEFVLIQP
ncbi:MAG TPA: hypothetical protein VE553_03870, partial [Candidatus Binatia bacterium]|nr:hypothetical protein [Candidatus Binatia bacterium]